MRVAAIGSGLSGLTAGAVLSRAGYQVDVFEQFHRAGGVTAPYLRFTSVMTLARRAERSQGVGALGQKLGLYLKLLPLLPRKDWSAQQLMDD